jgi:GntR family transcriptional regulator/MocR family aminotransferase
VPVDGAGLTIASRQSTPRIIFVTPSHQYPTGCLMSVSRRLDLLRFAEATRASIIEDDYDGEFHYEGQPITALQGVSWNECVFYLGTFSKSMFADARVGYIVVPEPFVQTFEVAQRHLGLVVTSTMQSALAEFIGAGFYRAHVRRMTRLYRLRRDRVRHALTTALGDRFTIDVPAGGMQLLARCKVSIDDRMLSQRLLERGVVTVALSSMTYHKTRASGLFCGFAAWNDREIDAAAAVLDRHMKSDTTGVK